MLEIRNIAPDEFEWRMSRESRNHGNRLAYDLEHLRPCFDLGRFIAVFDDGQIVDGCHSHQLEMSIPGGTSVVTSVSNVEVQTTHTRRGIICVVMAHQIVNSKAGESPAFTLECQHALHKKPHSLPGIPGYWRKVWRHLTAC